MTWADAVGLILFVGVIVYAVFAGADFGSGVWDLTAGDATAGGPLRALIDHSIGPVWEANHVWLIFVLVYLWSGFPGPFAAICSTLAVPLALAGLGIVLRGSAFAFRKSAPRVAQARVFGAVFAASSVITPFFLGAIAGAIASGRVPADGGGDAWRSWWTPTSVIGGVLAVLSCAFLAATFLTAEAARTGEVLLAATCRRRALATGVVTGAVALVAVAVLDADAHTLVHGLTHRGAPLLVVSGVGGVASLADLLKHRPARARVGAVVAVAAVVAGWGAAQYPWILVDRVRIAEGAGAEGTLIGLVVVFAIATATVVPALVALFRFTQSATSPGDGRTTGAIDGADVT